MMNFEEAMEVADGVSPSPAVAHEALQVLRRHCLTMVSSGSESPRDAKEQILQIVSPVLVQGGTLGAPDWAIRVAHAVAFANDPDRRLASTPARAEIAESSQSIKPTTIAEC